jgi:hypothetical protein
MFRKYVAEIDDLGKRFLQPQIYLPNIIHNFVFKIIIV